MPALGDPIVTGRSAQLILIVCIVAFLAAVLAIIFGTPELQQTGLQTVPTSLIGAFMTHLMAVNARERERVEKRHEAERAMLTQRLEHAFSVGSSSHMANVAFDKHVHFCEAYAEALRSTLATFLREGPTELVLSHSATLADLRHKHALWLTPEMEAPLEKFEQALRDLGANEFVVNKARDLVDAERRERINLIYERFQSILGEKLMGKSEGGTSLDEAVAIGNVIRGLGRALGVDDLTHLRHKILRNAAATGTGKP